MSSISSTNSSTPVTTSNTTKKLKKKEVEFDSSVSTKKPKPSLKKTSSKRLKSVKDNFNNDTAIPFIMCSLAATGDTDAIQKFLKEHQNTQDVVNKADYDKRTALHLAAEEGHMETVKLLLTHGADVNALDRWGATPLAGATANFHPEIATLLRENGAHLNDVVVQAGAAALAAERVIIKCHDVFDSIASTAKATQRVLQSDFERFVNEHYGLDVRLHVLLRNEIRQLVKTSQEEMGGNGRDIHWNALRKQLDIPGSIVAKAFKNQLAIIDWLSWVEQIKDVFFAVERDVPETEGVNAQYIPELADVDPSLFAVTLCTVDGQVLSLGDYDSEFAIESCMKPILYSLNLETYGEDSVHTYIGREPSGASFNAFTLNQHNKPHNSCINAGAIINSALYHPDLSLAKRYGTFTAELVRMSGGLKPNFSQAVYLSEKSEAWSNFALAHFMRSHGGFPPNANFEEAVDFYFQLCSIEVTTPLLASVGSTYANGGVNPLTGERIMTEENVKKNLQLMYSCGMYDFSGEWACTVGVPAKSGVGGAIYLVIPSRCGVCVRAPPLDQHGNSVRSIEFCKRLVDRLQWSVLDVLFTGHANRL
eukprot:CAMPEP_0168596482 /NCGR_PEP_ID=MMETSP0420-20121227/10044_1 /TAXON_ID=498008 /ORGANISM="Pessonella sp." /LENGTH=591 /DNA_ID=CAMNT_0008633049 /DNA_START=69 /DNA_END=1844 /DNA_ORIENTATION=+